MRMKKTLVAISSMLVIAGCQKTETDKLAIEQDETDIAKQVVPGKTQRDVVPIPERRPGQIIDESLPEEWIDLTSDNVIYLDIAEGRIVIVLTSDLAPAHVAQTKKLILEKYYDGLHFYRVIDGFVAQGGDESGEKSKGSAKDTLAAEFDEPWRDGLTLTKLGVVDGYADEVGFINGFPAARDIADQKVWLTHCTGAFAFGRDKPRDSASTEFYITLQPQRYLDRNLTVFGRVVWGMEHVQAIPRGKPSNGGAIEDKTRWTKIKSMRLASDVAEEDRTALQMMDTNSASFKEYLLARMNRPEDFFYFRPNHVDLCQVQLPVRIKPESEIE